jgi:hypothetical protein
VATYTIIGHPLNYADLTMSTQANTDAVHVALQNNGVGQSVTLVLSGPDDTKVKGHGCFK